MAFGQCQIVHICIEVMVAFGTAVLGIHENNIAWAAGKQISQVMQGACDGAKPIRTVLAQRTWPPFIVAAAPNDFGFW